MYLQSLVDSLSEAFNRYFSQELFFNLKAGEILLFSLFIFSIIAINWIIKKPLKKALKLYLFRGRRELWKRLFFYRVEKVFKPLRYLLSLYLLQIALKIFFPYPLAIVEDIFFFLYVLLFAKFLYEIVKYFLYKSLNEKIKKYKGARRELFNLFLNITKVFIGIVIAILILSKIGVDLTALITSLGIGGVIIGFSSKEALTNFFDSIRLISEDAFRQGDWIETKDIEGFVTEIGLVATKIRTFDNALVTIPNSLLANNYVKNWTKRVIGRRIKFYIKIKITTNFKELDRVLF
ncbi:MAG: mechanosensitive ion channel family protein, partial [Epsilonproteobacteria bacterium]|nr:mechanosensitive ion channel family protein [Campylobacterota bacterium]